jgi:hypothetical protein
MGSQNVELQSRLPRCVVCSSPVVTLSPSVLPALHHLALLTEYRTDAQRGCAELTLRGRNTELAISSFIGTKPTTASDPTIGPTPQQSQMAAHLMQGQPPLSSPQPGLKCASYTSFPSSGPPAQHDACSDPPDAAGPSDRSYPPITEPTVFQRYVQQYMQGNGLIFTSCILR